MSGPLDGVRVLEVATHVFVPGAATILQEWGASVVKIEHPLTGDAYRGLVTVGLHKYYAGVDVNFQCVNRGKESVGIDLATDEGRGLLARFIEQSDVFLTSLRPAARAALGVELDDVRAHNEAIVYVCGSGYGPSGPDAERGGYDIAAYWARSGMASRVTPPEVDWPLTPPPAFGDLAGGMAIAGAVTAALYQRSVTGRTSEVDVSLLGVGMWQLQPDIVTAKLDEREGTPASSAPKSRSETWNPLAQSYRTRDGRFIALVMIDADRHWEALCELLDAPELASDPRFHDLAARRENSAACVALLDDLFAARDYSEWCTILAPLEGAWAPVNTPLEVHADPQVEANAYLGDADLGNGHSLPMVGAPARFDGVVPQPTRAPEVGEHTESALVAMGLSWNEISDLKQRNVIS